jgi:hypothetical protein
VHGYPVHAMNKAEAPRPPLENVAMVAKLKERLLQNRNTVEKIGDAIGSFRRKHVAHCPARCNLRGMDSGEHKDCTVYCRI